MTMPDIVFNEEWVVESRLTEKTGLSVRQIKGYRGSYWVEGVHFKRIPYSGGDTSSRHGLVWYNYPKINQLVQEA